MGFLTQSLMYEKKKKIVFFPHENIFKLKSPEDMYYYEQKEGKKRGEISRVLITLISTDSWLSCIIRQLSSNPNLYICPPRALLEACEEPCTLLPPYPPLKLWPLNGTPGTPNVSKLRLRSSAHVNLKPSTKGLKH